MKRLSLILFILIVAACAGLNGNQKSALSNQADQNLTCMAGSDCDKKWAHALQWMRINSAYPILSQTPTLIQTADPPTFSDKSGFTVTLETMPDSGPNGPYIITFSSSCSAFSCTPSALELRASFVDYVVSGGNPAQ